MAIIPRLQRISEADLGALIGHLREQGTTELILLGPEVRLAASVDQWPEDLRDKPEIYQLKEPVVGLAERVAALTQLTSLDLSHNGIGAAGAEALVALTQLTSLNLSYNGISDATAEALAALSQLTSLDLQNNQIGAEGAESLAALTQLTSLNLARNGIGATGAAALAALTRLTSLNLVDNGIGAPGAASLAALSKLTSLDLQNNQIGAEGAESLAALSQLTSLNLSHNEIGDAGAAALAALTKLTSLNLVANGIGDAGAAALALLTQLTSLILADNQIGDEGAVALAALTQLNSLNLVRNRIGSTGAASLAGLTRLTSLNLSHNGIGDEGAMALAALTQLTSLNLSHNGIGDEGAAALAALTRLTSLDLHSNEIGAAGAAALAALTRLTTLDLAGTQVAELTPIATLSNLQKLDLSESRVSDLLPIKPLLLRGVEAQWRSQLPFDWDKKGIYVRGCPLTQPPPETIQRGHEAVLNFFRELEAQGVEHLFEAKVLIVGQGGAGKTSLLRRLFQPDRALPAEDESTKGIDIYSDTFPRPDGRSFRLNVWDFGGQQIYHATHQFFLTKRSLYILLDDTRKDDKTVHDEGFKFWLEVIEVLSDRSPVLIFQNEKSGRSKSIDEAGIKGRFPNVRDVFRGNLEHADAADALREAIRYHVQHLSHVGESVPAGWLAIRSELEEMAKNDPFITQKQYFDFYGRHLEFNRTKALRLSQYLHDLGVFLHFQEDALLRRYVILQNQWATEAVFNVLDDEPVKARSGYFTREDCERIWTDSTTADMHPELLALMEKFELCYKVPDRDPPIWLCPQLLSPSTPREFEDWNRADDLVVAYQYDFLPTGIITRLMVRMHRFVPQPEHSWVSGAYFQQGESQLLARLASPGGQEIELRARGPERKALMSVIASDLDALNASFEGLRDKVRKLVPCLCSKCRLSTTPERYEEPRLLKRKQDGKLLMECPDSYEEVRVLELLDGLKLEVLPPWVKPRRDRMEDSEPDDAPSPPVHQPAQTAPVKKIRIFLASSSELKEDRKAFDLHFRQENDRLLKKGLYLEIVCWENFLDAMSTTRLQDEYNEAVRNCDIFVSLFKTKTGKYTEEEFNVAHKAFKDSGKPLIFTYFMRTEVSNDRRHRDALNSLWAFQDKLSELGHYHTEYNSIEDLQLQFRRRLDMLMEEDKV